MRSAVMRVLSPPGLTRMPARRFPEMRLVVTVLLRESMRRPAVLCGGGSPAGSAVGSGPREGAGTSKVAKRVRLSSVSTGADGRGRDRFTRWAEELGEARGVTLRPGRPGFMVDSVTDGTLEMR